MTKTLSKKHGYALVEILLAIAIFITTGTSIVYLLLDANLSNLQSRDRVLLSNYAQNGIEITRNIRDSGFEKITLGNHGLALQNGSWIFSGESDVDPSGRFSRQITVSKISDDNLLITSKASRIIGLTRPLSITYSTYLSNWAKITLPDPSWNNPQVIGTAGTQETSGNRNPFGIFVVSNYTYLVADQPSGSGSEFFIFDSTNKTAPSLVGKIATGKKVYNVFISGNYAFLATQNQTSTKPEMVVIDISSPTAPLIVSRTSFAGNNFAKDIVVSGNYAYITTLNSNGPEFVIINISDPIHPITTPVGSLEIGANVNSINIENNYAYLATANDTKEIQIINISNPATPVIAKTYNNPGTADASQVLFNNNYLYLSNLNNTGTNPNFSILTINPIDLSIQLVGQIQISGNINDISLDESGNQVFASTSVVSQEFLLFDITNKFLPSIKSSETLSGPAVAIKYDSEYAQIAVNNTNSQLVIVGKGQ